MYQKKLSILKFKNNVKKNLNICQVSLDNNIPLIIENFLNFKKIYDEVRVLFCVLKNN